MKPRCSKVIVVEGKYDKIRIESLLDATVLTTEGFGIFKNTEKRAMIKRLAEKRGLVILADPDGAGKVIRGHLHTLTGGRGVSDLYVPPTLGKERRKSAPGKEGKLGVEGMKPEIILEALRRAGATMEGEDAPVRHAITKQDMMELGLSGGADASAKRQALMRKLNLPEHMSPNALLQALNLLYTLEELTDLVRHLE